jgi:phospholipid/cholesterol/gamma-HCH transport system substrate-binding protein
VRRLKAAGGMLSDRMLGAMVIAGLVALSILVFGGMVNRAFEGKGKTVTAVFNDTSQLVKGDPVRVRGVNEGRVRHIRLNRDGRTATVTMEVYGEALPLHRDASATVKQRTALGGNYFVDLVPGHAAAGPLPSQHIPVARTTNPVEVDTVLRNLRDGERRGLKTLFREVPNALSDRPALPRALSSVADSASLLRAGVAAARGEHDGDLRVLVENTARLTDSLAQNSQALTAMVQHGALVTESIADRGADVQALLDRSASVAPRVEETMRRLDGTLRLTDPLLARLRVPAGEVAPTLRTLRPTLIGAEHLLADARPLFARLRPAATSLAAAARDGSPLLSDLAPSLERLADKIIPDLSKPDPVTRRSTFAMMGPTAAGFSSAAAAYDNLSHFVGLASGGGEGAVDTSPCRTYFTDPDAAGAHDVAECDDIAKFLDDLLHYKP